MRALSPSVQRVAASLESVERLEVLLHLRALNGRREIAQNVAAGCRISLTSAERHLAKLCARGYLAVEIGTALHYSYRPLDPTTRKAVDELEHELTSHRAETIARFEEQPRHVLIAEDDADMREILRLYLEGRGFRTTTVPHGRDARMLAETENFALAVVDVRPSLPQGLALVRTLRERRSPVPTIVMTSFGDARLQTRISSFGVNNILEKPFELDDFERMLERSQ